MSTFLQLATDLGQLCESKQAAYGDSIGKSAQVLAILYPHGLTPKQYLDAILAARIFDKLARKAQGADPHGESPYLDAAGYALKGLQHHSREVHAGCNTSAPTQAVSHSRKGRTASAARNTGKRSISPSSGKGVKRSGQDSSAAPHAESSTTRNRR
jgi:hypothetical protein